MNAAAAYSPAVTSHSTQIVEGLRQVMNARPQQCDPEDGVAFAKQQLGARTDVDFAWKLRDNYQDRVNDMRRRHLARTRPELFEKRQTSLLARMFSII